MSGKKGCFLPGTQIKVPSGIKPIEDFKIGDEVIAYDKEGNLSTGKVTETFKHDTNVTKDVVVEVMHENGILRTTTNHWILTSDGETFKEAQHFDLDEEIILEDGSLSKVTGIIYGMDTLFTYNLSVDPHHTFIADGVRVHNKGGEKGGSTRAAVEAPNTLQSIAYVNIVDVVSEGEIEGLVTPASDPTGATSIYFDETPLVTTGAWNFTDTYVSWKRGAHIQETPEGKFGSSGTVHNVNAEMYYNIDVARVVTDTDVDAVRCIITIPRLVQADASTGDRNPTSVSFNVYANAAYLATITITGKCTSAYQKEVIIYNLQSISFPVTITLKRITADSGSDLLANQTIWTSYTELIYEKLYYGDTAYFAVQSRADQFQSVPARKYLVDGIRVKIPTNYTPSTNTYSDPWDGALTTTKYWTSNPAWVLYDLLTNKRYGYGLDESQIDLASFYSAGYYADNFLDDGTGTGTNRPRCTLNTQVMNNAESFYLANLFASNMFAQLYWAGGKVYIAQDRPTDPIINVTNANVEDGSFNYVSSSRKDRHTQIAVTWNDPDDNYRTAVEFVDDKEGIIRYGVRRLDTLAYGCTNRMQARRWGKWILFTEQYETETVNYIAGLDHAGVAPGEVVSIVDEFYVGSRNGGRVVSATSNTIKLDADVTIELAESYEIQVTLPNGTIEKKSVSLPTSGTTDTLTISGTFTDTPTSESVWQLIYSIVPREFRVVSKTETEPNKYQIQGVLYDSNKYLFIDGTDVFDAAIYTTINDSNVLDPPTSLDAEEYQSTQGTSRRFNVLLSWVHSPDPRRLYYQTEWRLDGFPYQPHEETTENSTVFENVLTGLYHFRVRSIGVTGKSPWATLDNFSMVADTTAAVDITGLQVKGGGTTFDGKHCEFEWDEVTLFDEADFRDYKIQILDPSDDSVLRTAYTITNDFVYTWEMNAEDNAGVPLRSIKVKVWCRDIYDSLSINEDTATFSNPAPDMSATAPVVTPRGGYLLIDWTNVPDNDMDYYELYLNDSTGTLLATLTYPTNQLSYFNVEYGTTYYFTVLPYDLFGVGVESQQGSASPNKFPSENINVELLQSMIITDSIDTTEASIIELYDGILDEDGVTYPSGDQWIEYNYNLEDFVNAVQVWADSTAQFWVEVTRQDGTKRYYGGDAGHNLVFSSDQYRLTEYGSLAAAQTNYWETDDTGYQYAFLPNGVVGQYVKVHFNSGSGIQIYEMVSRRIVIAEDIAVENLSAIVADIGTIVAGNLQSQDYSGTEGMIIDLDNKDIEIRKSGVDKLIYDGATGNLSVNGNITVTGGSGIANYSDAGALALQDTVGLTDCDTTLISGGKIATDLVVANSIAANSITSSEVGANQIITNTANIGTAKVTTLHLVGNSVSNDVTYSNATNTSINAWTYGSYYTVFSFDYVINSTQPEYVLIFNGHIGADVSITYDCNYVNYSVGLVFRWRVYNVTTATTLYTFNDQLGLLLAGTYTCYAFCPCCGSNHRHNRTYGKDSGGNFLYSRSSGFSAGDTIRLYCEAGRINGTGTAASCTGNMTIKQAQITGLKR